MCLTKNCMGVGGHPKHLSRRKTLFRIKTLNKHWSTYQVSFIPQQSFSIKNFSVRIFNVNNYIIWSVPLQMRKLLIFTQMLKISKTGTTIQGHNNTKNGTNKKRKKQTNNQMLCFAIKELFLHSPCQAVAGLSSLEASQFACRCHPTIPTKLTRYRKEIKHHTSSFSFGQWICFQSLPLFMQTNLLLVRENLFKSFRCQRSSSSISEIVDKVYFL